MKKIAVVTGASSGMGKDFALQLPEFFETDEMWLIARRKEKLLETEEEIKRLSSQKKYKKLPHIRVIEADLCGRKGISAYESLLKAEKLLEEKNGGFEISVLVNNAGFGTYGTFESSKLEEELNMIDLNCTTLTGLTGLSIPFMKKGSSIINTASLASFLPLGNFAVYGATKAFVLSFSVALAAELKDKGIKVTSLCPGPVSTEFANVASGGARKEVLHGKPSAKVVRHAIKKSAKGKVIAIYAFKWKFKAFMSRFVGRYAGAWFTFKFCKRPHS